MPVRRALYTRLTAQGVSLTPQVQELATERLAALLVVLEDPFWTESDSVLSQDAQYMIQLIKEGEGRPRR